MKVVTLEVPELGNRCHLVHDGASASSSTRRATSTAVEARPTRPGVEITAVADTHVHNDYVSGALGLARRHGADYLLSADERVDVRAGRRPRRRRRRRSAASASRCSRRPGPHPAPPVLPGRRGRRRPGRAASAAAACCTAPSAAPTSSTPRLTARPGPRPVGQRPARSARSTPRTAPAPDPRLRQLLRRRAPPCRDGGDATIGEQRADQPGADRCDRDGLRRRPGRRLRPGARLLPATWPRSTARAPAGPSPGRRAPVTAEEVTDAVLRGDWVVDLRHRASYADGARARHGQRRVRHPVRDVRRLAGAVAGRHRAADRLPHRPRARAARPGRDRHRRASGTHVLDAGDAARPRRTAAPTGPASARRAGPRGAWSTSASATSTTPATCRAPLHLPVQDVEVRGRDAARRRALGALPLRLPGRHRRQPAAPDGPQRRARRRRLGPGRRARHPDHGGRRRRLSRGRDDLLGCPVAGSRPGTSHDSVAGRCASLHTGPSRPVTPGARSRGA